MRDGKRKHMDKDSRAAIEEGIGRGDSARKIAKEASVSPSTVFCQDDMNRRGWYRLSVPFSLGCKG